MALKQKSIIGADIGANTLQLVNATGSGKIKRAISYELPNGVVSSMQVSTPEMLTNTIKAAKRAGGITGSKCILCLGGTEVIIRHLSLPLMNDAQIYENVINEISTYLPVNTENYSIDYSIQQDPSQEQTSQIKVMVVAIPKAPLQMYIECFKKAGIRVTAIDISENAQEKLVRYLLPTLKEATYNFGIIDLGAETANVTSYLDGHFFVNKVSSFGGDLLTNDLAEALSMDALQAETTKMQENFFTKDTKESKVVKRYADDIIFEASRVFDYFKNRNNYQTIDKVFLCGGASHLPGLTQYMQENLDIEVMSLEDMMLPLFTKHPVIPNCAVYAAAVGATFREV